jgi:hypothetical protein
VGSDVLLVEIRGWRPLGLPVGRWLPHFDKKSRTPTGRGYEKRERPRLVVRRATPCSFNLTGTGGILQGGRAEHFRDILLRRDRPTRFKTRLSVEFQAGCEPLLEGLDYFRWLPRGVASFA